MLELERLFQAIADKQRIRILNLLLTAEDAVCVCEFVPALGLSQATVSYHLKQLTEAGLLVKERRSYYVYYRVAPRPSNGCGPSSRPRSRSRKPSSKGGIVSVESAESLREEVRRRYAEEAERATRRGAPGCGDGSCCEGDVGESGFGAALYSAAEHDELPARAARASLGCGNPAAIADLRAGEVVLDLGSGGGIDVLLSAKRVGPTGTVYGLDMTDEMLALAQANASEADATNVHFLKGLMEAIPLPADSVDVIISNCVINLSVEKADVLLEMSRVLKPGGRLGISDVVAEDGLTEEEQAERGSHIGCIAGALSKAEWEVGLESVGFEDVSVEFTHEVADGLHGAIIKAVKTTDPAARGLPVIQPATRAGCC